MIVIVCGGRDYKDHKHLWKVLDNLRTKLPITRLIEGGARGADSLAHAWRLDRGVPGKTYKARWETEGVSAGPRRNRRMLEQENPDMVIAFPGGNGTADMKIQARRRGVKVLEVI
jgi:hypothetical protein